ncbi:hypothetical protein Tco_1202121 [Tanacetum coccineum]
MTTLADKSLLSGGDNKPSMLEKHLYDSWKSKLGWVVDCDIKPTNYNSLGDTKPEGLCHWLEIIKFDKELWEEVKLSCKELHRRKQERECKLMMDSDKFAL